MYNNYNYLGIMYNNYNYLGIMYIYSLSETGNSIY